MSMTTPLTTSRWTLDPDPLRCVDCEASLGPEGDGLACPACGRAYPVRDGVLVVKEEPTADNRIARDFYDGALWPRFRFWEWLFFVTHGGERKAREVILRHLPREVSTLRLLDVAIGDGVYVDWLPPTWDVVGIDVSTGQLAECSRRNVGRNLRLVLGEAEALPFHDHAFDAILSIGGFNHFNDPEGALREMVRVARPGAPIVISDELPDLTERMIGHKLGMPAIDRWFVARVMKLGDDFTDLVERHRHINIAEIGRRVLEGSHYQTIWQKAGYLMVGRAPSGVSKTC